MKFHHVRVAVKNVRNDFWMVRVGLVEHILNVFHAILLRFVQDELRSVLVTVKVMDGVTLSRHLSDFPKHRFVNKRGIHAAHNSQRRH